MSDLLARLISDGTSPELVAEVAMLLAEKRLAQSAIEERRTKDRERQNRRRSRDVTDCHVTECDNETSPSLSRPLPPQTPPTPTHTHPEYISRTREAENGQECSQVVEAWNAMATGAGLPTVAKLTDKRRRSLRNRLRDDGMTAIRAAIERIPKSAFLTGSTGWRADFDFLLQPDRVTAINEGKYDNGPTNKPDSVSGLGRGTILDRIAAAKRAAEEEGSAEDYFDHSRSGVPVSARIC